MIVLFELSVEVGGRYAQKVVLDVGCGFVVCVCPFTVEFIYFVLTCLERVPVDLLGHDEIPGSIWATSVLREKSGLFA